MKMRGLKLGKLRRIPVLLIALLPILLAQTGQEIPRRDILHLFLINIRHFDKEAQKLQARGMLKEAKELRSYDASRAGLTTSEEALLHQEAEAMETALQEKDQQAKLTLEAAEARLKKNSRKWTAFTRNARR
jgi:hypothetical protein